MFMKPKWIVNEKFLGDQLKLKLRRSDEKTNSDRIVNVAFYGIEPVCSANNGLESLV